MRVGESVWGITWRRFRRSRLAMAALWWVGFMSVVAILAPVLANRHPIVEKTANGWTSPALSVDPARDLPPREVSFSLRAPIPHSPDWLRLSDRFEPPDAAHYLGTDELGRDVLARMIHGTRVSLLVGLLTAAIALLVGATLGAIAGYYGSAADWIVSRVIEIVLCFPLLFLVLGIVALFKPSLYTIIIALGLTAWTSEARFVRAEVLRIRELEFAHAARASGAGDARIIFRHLLPNALAPALVSASFAVAYAVLTESSLSFLGFGVALPTASWGSILSAAQQNLEAWWLSLFPGLAIFATVGAFNVIGDRFREALDPRGE